MSDEAKQGDAEKENVCIGKIVIGERTWKLEPEPSVACRIALTNISNLGPAAKEYVCKHIKPSDPEQKEKLDGACELGS